VKALLASGAHSAEFMPDTETREEPLVGDKDDASLAFDVAGTPPSSKKYLAISSRVGPPFSQELTHS
jgi:hypothetical protein